MSQRWGPVETQNLSVMKAKLRQGLNNRRQLPDVIGDRRLLRFLRGYQYNTEKAIVRYNDFLSWRDNHGVDNIRDDILHRKRSVEEFPFAGKILPHIGNQIVIAADGFDNFGNPITYEEVDGNPDDIVRSVKKEEFVLFMIYLHEYRSLVLEQLSHELELAQLSNLAKRSPSKSRMSPTANGHGVLLSCTSIRDFHNFRMEKFGTSAKTLLKWMIDVSNKNYPDMMFRSYMVNVPWFYNSAWYFMKGRLNPHSVEKFVVTTVDKLANDIPAASIPTFIGGRYVQSPSARYFQFDLSDSGPFYIPANIPRGIDMVISPTAGPESQQTHLTAATGKSMGEDLPSTCAHSDAPSFRGPSVLLVNDDAPGTSPAQLSVPSLPSRQPSIVGADLSVGIHSSASDGVMVPTAVCLDSPSHSNQFEFSSQEGSVCTYASPRSPTASSSPTTISSAVDLSTIIDHDRARVEAVSITRHATLSSVTMSSIASIAAPVDPSSNATSDHPAASQWAKLPSDRMEATGRPSPDLVAKSLDSQEEGASTAGDKDEKNVRGAMASREQRLSQSVAIVPAPSMSTVAATTTATVIGAVAAIDNAATITTSIAAHSTPLSDNPLAPPESSSTTSLTSSGLPGSSASSGDLVTSAFTDVSAGNRSRSVSSDTKVFYQKFRGGWNSSKSELLKSASTSEVTGSEFLLEVKEAALNNTTANRVSTRYGLSNDSMPIHAPAQSAVEANEDSAIRSSRVFSTYHQDDLLKKPAPRLKTLVTANDRPSQTTVQRGGGTEREFYPGAGQGVGESDSYLRQSSRESNGSLNGKTALCSYCEVGMARAGGVIDKHCSGCTGIVHRAGLHSSDGVGDRYEGSVGQFTDRLGVSNTAPAQRDAATAEYKTTAVPSSSPSSSSSSSLWNASNSGNELHESISSPVHHDYNDYERPEKEDLLLVKECIKSKRWTLMSATSVSTNSSGSGVGWVSRRVTLFAQHGLLRYFEGTVLRGQVSIKGAIAREVAPNFAGGKYNCLAVVDMPAGTDLLFLCAGTRADCLDWMQSINAVSAGRPLSIKQIVFKEDNPLRLYGYSPQRRLAAASTRAAQKISASVPQLSTLAGHANDVSTSNSSANYSTDSTAKSSSDSSAELDSPSRPTSSTSSPSTTAEEFPSPAADSASGGSEDDIAITPGSRLDRHTGSASVLASPDRRQVVSAAVHHQQQCEVQVNILKMEMRASMRRGLFSRDLTQEGFPGPQKWAAINADIAAAAAASPAVAGGNGISTAALDSITAKHFGQAQDMNVTSIGRVNAAKQILGVGAGQLGVGRNQVVKEGLLLLKVLDKSKKSLLGWYNYGPWSQKKVMLWDGNQRAIDYFNVDSPDMRSRLFLTGACLAKEVSEAKADGKYNSFGIKDESGSEVIILSAATRVDALDWIESINSIARDRFMY